MTGQEDCETSGDHVKGLPFIRASKANFFRHASKSSLEFNRMSPPILNRSVSGMNIVHTLIYRFENLSSSDFTVLALAIVLTVWYISNYSE